MMLTISYMVLIAGCAICAALLFRQPEKLSDANKTRALLVTVGAGFIAIAGVTSLIVSPGNQDSETMLRLFNNLKNFIGLPLIASILLAFSLGKAFSRATWGRWVLVLFALFELLRRSGAGDTYAIALEVVTSIALCLSFVFGKQTLLKRDKASIRLPGILGAIFIGSSICLLGPHAIDPYAQSSDWHNISLGIGLALLGLAAGRWINSNQQLSPTSPSYKNTK
ncbi:hypothetical protein [Neptunomonas phycophila]|uniref:hypothetical protein n=1 Tax=Neptunomonas phycophila TaxID=1572645 RepID=UPI000948ACAA|nr:hypothetical protein [Neptunomonas phycophila]